MLGGIGGVAVEYWACYKPVIYTTQGETAKLIKRCNGGIVIPPQNPQAMAEAILYLYKDRDTARHMGSNGRELVMKEFAYEHVKQHLIQVINDMASQ